MLIIGLALLSDSDPKEIIRDLAISVPMPGGNNDQGVNTGYFSRSMFTIDLAL
mgnify:CR=1 FL=1